MKKSQKIRVSYAQTVYGKSEINAVLKVLANPSKIVPGDKVKEFERKIAALFGKKFGVMVNSGSSANLLAIESLNLPKGSEVITPMLTFATTVAPLVQKGLIPVFVDVDPGTYIINHDQVEQMITKKTKALMIPSLIGNIPDMERLRRIAKKHKLYFIEDSCDTLGAKFKGKPTGYYSDISTTSFYASHITTTAGAGGMVCFKDSELGKRALILGSWGRESTLFGVHEKSEDLKKRFKGVIDGQTYDAKFIFSMLGYNFQSTELSGAFGLEQLKRLKEFANRRKKNFSNIVQFLKLYENFLILPKQDKRVNTNWLSVPLTIKKNAPFTRLEITKFLEEHNIQTRPIFTGTIIKQPGFKNIKCKKRKSGYPITNHVMKNGFLIGCHHGMTTQHLAYLKQTLKDFFEQL